MSNSPPASTPPRIRDVGEFGLIARLQALVAARRPPPDGEGPRLLLSIGDDCAAWQPTPGAREVITTDALIEDVHFRRSTTSWADLGWKALAVNVSDVAAMGAAPRYALVTLGAPRDTPVADLEALYAGMLDLATEYQLDIIGGDVVAAPVVVLNLTVVGDSRGELLRRDAARIGDLLAVSGALGASRGGLELLESGRQPNDQSGPLFEAHRRPRPRVAEAAALVESGVRCAMDLSDGLLGDAAHIGERSGLAAMLERERVPVHPALQAVFGEAALGMALGGGEDYELLCAAPADVLARASAALVRLGTPLSVVGRLVERGPDDPLVRVIDPAGRPIRLDGASWDHFRAR